MIDDPDSEPYPPEPAPTAAPADEPAPEEPAPPGPEAEEPAIPDAPAAAGVDELRDAIGIAPLAKKKANPLRDEIDRAHEREREERDRDLDSDEEPPKKRGKLGLVVAIFLIVGGAIATLVLLGRANGARYVFHCGDQRITAEEGRGFPPWGTRGLGGAEWKPIAIAPATECQSRETEKRGELEQWYLDALMDQAQEKLGARDVTAVDDAEAELQQALLLARDPDRRDQRKDIDRLLGDVEYWRGAAQVKSAIDLLDQAGARFDAANEKRPRHQSDAASWSAWVRQVAGQLRTGPGGTGPASAPPSAAPTPAPTGVALPVEEPGERRDAAPEPPPPADAGVPRGGVLL